MNPAGEGEGKGSFRFTVREGLVKRFRALPSSIQVTIKSMLYRAVTEPVAARVVFAEGQSLVNGTAFDEGKLYYIQVRFVYDPEQQLVVLAEMTQPLLIPGMH